MKVFCGLQMGFLFLFLAFGTAFASTAASPTAAIKGPIDQIMKVLNDPQFKPIEKKTDQRDKIWKIARPMFDANMLSQRVIGKPWANFSVDEKSRFTDIFTRFLGTTYIEKMQGQQSNVKINYDKELVKGNRALVRTMVMRESLNIAIDYRMNLSEGQWKIYDVLVDKGVSLVKNYRVQFGSILKKETPEQLIKRLEKKLTDKQLDPNKPSSEPTSAAGK